MKLAEAHRSRLEWARTPSLDDRTWDDLHLDDVFSAIDQTTSTLGQHALYHRLRTSPVSGALEAFEALVTRMSTDVPARERARKALARLQDPHGYDLWWLARPDAVETQSWYVVFPFLAAAALLALILTVLAPHLWPALAAAIGVNVVVRAATDRRIRAAAGAFRQLAPLIATAQSLTFLAGEDIQPIVGPLRVHVPGLAGLKAIARWVSANPLMLSLDSPQLAIAMNDVALIVYEYFNVAFLLDANAVYFGAGQVRARSGGLLAAMAAMGDIDAAMSVASFRAGTDGWIRPRFLAPDAPAMMTGIRHPLVPDAVPNSIALGPPHGVLITGSNMSGKSTFLRTVGVNAVLAQTINTCLASRYEAPVFHVRSCIGRSDDLIAGKSYYIVEVDSLLELLRASASASPHLFLLDELFRGTNAVERIAAAEAVLIELLVDGNRAKPHVVLAATHDGELVDLLRDVYESYHFTDTLGQDGLVFDYRLQAGPATTRNAIALLELHGASKELVRRALARAEALDEQRQRQ